MKQLELTKEHKSKLLEMCNELFPEYKEIILTKQKNLNFGFKNNKSHTLRIANMSIHWFEFVFCHLVTKLQSVISNKLGEEAVWREQPEYVSNVFSWKKGNRWTLYSEFMFFYPKMIYEQHPIDYLYEEFKKLK